MDTKATIILNEIRISSTELFREYFDFGELYELLKNDPYKYQMFLKAYYPAFTRLMFFGVRDAYKGQRDHPPIALLNSPADVLIQFPKYFQAAKDAEEGCMVQIEPLVYDLRRYYECCHLDAQGKICKDSVSLPSEFEQNMRDLLDTLTEEGKKVLSYACAVELYIYLLLHIQAGLLPKMPNSTSFKRLSVDLEQGSPANMKTGKNITITPAHTPEYTLRPFYSGTDSAKGRLEIVSIYNPEEHMVSCTVGIEGCVLQRTIAPGSRIYALRKNGAYISFLPRFVLVGTTVLLLENEKLCTLWKETTSYCETSIEHPVCWTHSNEYGTFVLNQNGTLDENSCWPEELPDRPVVAVTAFGMDYCMLLENGSVNSRLMKKGWEDLIAVSLGLNSGIAIGADRVPVQKDGKRLSLKNIIAACALDKHYLCLDADGHVFTDSDLKMSGKIYAASICPKGYVLAKEKGIWLIDFQNKIVQSWPHLCAEELAASEEQIVYFDQQENRILQIAL